MADRFATQFEIGGSLKRKKLEEFVSILQSDGFGLNYEDATAEAMTAEAERVQQGGGTPNRLRAGDRLGRRRLHPGILPEAQAPLY